MLHRSLPREYRFAVASSLSLTVESLRHFEMVPLLLVLSQAAWSGNLSTALLARDYVGNKPPYTDTF